MRADAMNIGQLMNDGIDWLINSGIREQNPELDVCGGFYQSYNIRSHQYDFIYSEIMCYVRLRKTLSFFPRKTRHKADSK